MYTNKDLENAALKERAHIVRYIQGLAEEIQLNGFNPSLGFALSAMVAEVGEKIEAGRHIVGAVEAERGPGTNTGHGWVWPLPDGVRARCGGPGMCNKCNADEAWLSAS